MILKGVFWQFLMGIFDFSTKCTLFSIFFFWAANFFFLESRNVLRALSCSLPFVKLFLKLGLVANYFNALQDFLNYVFSQIH